MTSTGWARDQVDDVGVHCWVQGREAGERRSLCQRWMTQAERLVSYPPTWKTRCPDCARLSAQGRKP